MRTNFTLWVSAAFVILSGCSCGPNTCNTNSDCSSGQVCSASQCVTPDAGAAGGSAAGGSAGGSAGGGAMMNGSGCGCSTTDPTLLGAGLVFGLAVLSRRRRR
ncbi:MAG: MYXO-CTERM sorting domain-containing protein [Myxococcales bacterium]|nr:MYXO-CTERM sorting domain-containing protein [Myxococcales bacterium]